MANEAEDWLSTRTSLLHRLKDWSDNASWQEFFDLYGHIIYRVGRQAGLVHPEAEDAVQETLLSVARQMPGFKYNPALGSFKAWLLNQTRWRVADQFRKRKPFIAAAPEASAAQETSWGNRIPDPASMDLDALWEIEWEKQLLATALTRIKHRVDPQKYQIFDLSVYQEWPVEKIAAAFSISPDQVYLTKHRLTEVLKAEVRRMEVEII